ncbi:hypothetical protein [Streptomyces sp. NPDC014623]
MLDALRETDPGPIATGERAMPTHLMDGHGELAPCFCASHNRSRTRV